MSNQQSEPAYNNLFNEVAEYAAKLTGVGIAVGSLHYGFSGMEEAGVSLNYAAIAVLVTPVLDLIKHGLHQDTPSAEAPLPHGVIYHAIDVSSPSQN